MQNLNKENFFNEMTGKYPMAMKSFCDFIDKYKLSVDWKSLFNEGTKTTVKDSGKSVHHDLNYSVKFHDLPIELQTGIIARWMEEIRNPIMHSSAALLFLEGYTFAAIRHRFAVLLRRYEHVYNEEGLLKKITKPEMYDLQETDLKNIASKGISNNG